MHEHQQTGEQRRNLKETRAGVLTERRRRPNDPEIDSKNKKHPSRKDVQWYPQLK